jgi:hypothetical protein
MSMRKHPTERQQSLWINTSEIAKSPGHPFYERLNRLFAEQGFDRFVESCCQRFYAQGRGRPSIPPGVYIRKLLIGYFEGIDSERGIAWRCADSLGLRAFLGYGRDRADAGPFESFGDPQPAGYRDASGGLSVGVEGPGTKRLAQG